MRGTAGGLMTGILMLTLLQAVVSSAGATGRLGALLAGAGTVVEHLSSPSIPAIPDLRTSSNITGPTTATAPVAAKAPPRLPPVANASPQPIFV